MTHDNLLEIGDLILYKNVVGSWLVPVVHISKKRVQIVFPDGVHLPLPRRTDGNVVIYPKGEINPFATCTVIPKKYRQ
jgi:hypothetical protein